MAGYSDFIRVVRPVNCKIAGAVVGAALGSLFTAHGRQAEAHDDVAAGAWCEQASLDQAPVQHVRARHLLDAHSLAQVLLASCPASPLRFRWQILDGLVLDELDEPLRAQQALFDVVTTAPSPHREVAATLLARSHLTARDEAAFTQALSRLSKPQATRLLLFKARDHQARVGDLLAELKEPALSAAALVQFSLYHQAAHTRRPWLAGTLSALLPGAGQAYSGSWQGGAVAFVLNAVLIGAAVELTSRRLYVSAGAAGVAASIFYVGNILNAADLARRRNEQAARPHGEALERTLVPEAYP